MVGQICSWCAVASFGVFTLLLCVFIYMLWSRCVEQNLCVFSVTTIRDHHKLPGLNNKNELSYSFVIQNCEIRCTKIKMSGGLFFFGSREEWVSFILPASRGHPFLGLQSFSQVSKELLSLYFLFWLQSRKFLYFKDSIRLDSSKIIQMVSPSQDLQLYSYLQSLFCDVRYQIFRIRI